MNLEFYQSFESTCPYLDGQVRQNIFTQDPELNPQQLQALLAHGFRRSGAMVYRPACPQCTACQATRIQVSEFSMSRSQRRCFKKNQDLTYTWSALCNDREHIELFQQYQKFKHLGQMDGSAEDYMEMFDHSHCEVRHLDFRKNGELVGVSIVDVLPNGLSSVYFYFSPKVLHLSLGTFSALVEIQECLQRHLSYWYIGYIVEQCPKMSYKKQFQPQERFVREAWLVV